MRPVLPRAPVPDETIRAIVTAYQTGATITALGVRFGVRAGRVAALLRQAGAHKGR
jgi:hypothetical protein